MPVPATPATELQLVEVFSSLQGEGLLIGRRQLFVRMAGCNLECNYCDTGHAADLTWRVEVEPGSGSHARHPNPVTPQILTGLIRQWHESWPIHHSLALTGGEPLMQSEALAAWLPQVNRLLPVFLETNGTLPEALSRLCSMVTWVSMDIKLTGTTGTITPWQEHAEFIRVAGNRLLQIKLVVDSGTSSAEIAEAAAFVHQLAAELPLVLQPRTINTRPDIGGTALLAMQEAAARLHPATLVVPQVHPLLSIS